MEKERIILHCDLNNFYASVECKLNPNLKNIAMAVGGSVETRTGIVLAKNNIAKDFGVLTAETIWQAKKKCKDLIIVPPHFEEYEKHSRLARDIYERYTDQVEPYGIDECWLDVTGSEIFGSGLEIAEKIWKEMKSELGLTISVGISFNKVFAKLGSDMKKSDAITVISKEDFQNKIWGLSASEMLGVGKATNQSLVNMGVKSIGDLAQCSEYTLIKLFGKNGKALKEYANGEDKSKVKSIFDDIKNCFRENDILGRIGGDEFVAFLEEIEEQYVLDYTEEVRNLMMKFNETENKGYNLSSAIGYGITTKDTKTTTVKKLFDIADEDMYQNKLAIKEKKKQEMIAQGIEVVEETDDKLNIIQKHQLIDNKNS